MNPMMTRTQLRAAMQKRTNAANKQAASELGLPKGFLQYAKRHGADAQSVQMERLKHSFIQR